MPHVAQFNYARMLYPLDDPRMEGFVARLEEINQLADRSPGFVWRLQTEEGDSTSLRPFGTDMLINMSVWETVEDLRNYTYKQGHLEVFRRRKDWFDRPELPHLVLWYVDEGRIPTIEEAGERLEHLAEHGPTDHAFTFSSVPQPA